MKKEDYPKWIYHGSRVIDLPEMAAGFVYRIVFDEKDVYGNNFQYIGKKLAVSTEKKKCLKSGSLRKNHIRFTYKNQGGKRVCYEVLDKDTKWREYIGSAEAIKNENLTPIHREILYFCPNKKSMTYYEIKAMMLWDALENMSFLNSNIQGTLYPKDTGLIRTGEEDGQN